MSGLWDFLSDPENRAILAWIGGGVSVAFSGLWVVVKHFGAGRPAPAPKPEPPPQVSARDGIAAGRDIRIGDGPLPRLALGLAALGMLLLALALILGRGDTITNSVTSGGDIEGSTITIDGPAPPSQN